jgi:hypothetical protein
LLAIASLHKRNAEDQAERVSASLFPSHAFGCFRPLKSTYVAFLYGMARLFLLLIYPPVS